MLQEIKQYIAEKVAQHIGVDAGEVLKSFKQPDVKERGDIALPCFAFAKVLRRPPQQIATELKNLFESDYRFVKVDAVGPYLNFKFDTEYLANYILPTLLDNSEPLLPQLGKGKTVVVDYSSPNIAKPIAFHHIRSTVIGNALCNIFEALGFRVVRINYLGDWGTTQGKLIVAFKRWGSHAKLEEEGIKHLLEIYVKFHEEAEKNPTIEEEARLWFKKCEEGDSEALSLWRKFRDISIKEFERIYNLLGVKFDHYDGESMYHKKAEEIFKLAAERAGARESEGAFVIPLDDEGLPPLLLRKKDGATLYATRDIAAAIDRYQRYKFDKSLYVVGSQQQLYFKQLFAALKKMGFDWAERMVHVAFGMLSIKDPDTGEISTGSTREGKVVFLEDVLVRAMRKVRQNVVENARKRKLQLTEDEIDSIARQVGVGAVVFADLTNRRINDVVFDWDRMLAVHGDTAVHVQYTHARCRSMMREAANIDYTKFNASHYTRKEEHQLLVVLSRFSEAVIKAAEELEPYILARYLLELSNAFVSLYELFKSEGYRFLDENKALRTSRMALVAATARVVKEGLALLGVGAPDKM